MRIKVQGQELTAGVVVVERPSDTGITCGAVQFICCSCDELHHSAELIDAIFGAKLAPRWGRRIDFWFEER
ncbi:hypothetical protein [Pandoraea captiosa]|uniref:hypothetical protein n=1 Tax=Pandoraea captiosa TaxID=2508302 RepID=UPI00124124A2|nr:hypothetical protein [Pandoraea captiosa]